MTRLHALLLLMSAGLGLIASGCAESSESPEVLVERGHLMESRGRLDEAVDAYTRALARKPEDANLYYDRGVAFGRQGHWTDAIADYTRAIEHDPGMGKAYNNRAAAYAHERRFEAAVADLTKAISLDPDSPLAFRNRGLAYHDLGQIARSIEDYTVAIRLDPNAFQNHFERGNAYLDSGDYPKAIADFDQALALDAKHASTWLNRGEARRRLGQNEKAQADFAEARRLDPNQRPSEVAQPAPPTKLAAPPTVAATDLPARRERSIAVAGDFLRTKGFQIEKSPAADSFPLIARKGDKRIPVCVELLADGQPTLRFTREELEQASRRDTPAALVVIGKLTPPSTPGAAFTGGAVVKYVENWKAVRDELVPVVFEYRVR